jgi:spore maturation protein CgeB
MALLPVGMHSFLSELPAAYSRRLEFWASANSSRNGRQCMKIVVFGLSISSTWGNGHATLWRGLCRALARRGHSVVFFEHDVPYYAKNRDVFEITGGELILYRDWPDAVCAARCHLADADVGMVTSYCPHGIEATDLVLGSPAACKVFYDLDTPVTLARLNAGETTTYIGPRGLGDFDLVLSYTGGPALDALRDILGARCVAPLYGSVDPEVHRPAAPASHYRADLSYLGTYAEDRQAALEALLVEPARRMPDRRFLIGGALYPEAFPWSANIFFVRHLPAAEHPSFYSSSRLTLNVTRQAMAQMGFCPSGRLFEAAACGVPILSDRWEGLDHFFEPGCEILIASDTRDAVEAIGSSDADLQRIAVQARDRTLAEHTADHRAAELETAMDGALHAHSAAALPAMED